MILYVSYIENIGGDHFAAERGFLHPENRTAIYYGGWLYNQNGCDWIEPHR